jgi:hypothetical protein
MMGVFIAWLRSRDCLAMRSWEFPRFNECCFSTLQSRFIALCLAVNAALGELVCAPAAFLGGACAAGLPVSFLSASYLMFCLNR